MVFFNHSFVFPFVMSAFLLSGCAISGSGNPISTNHMDSNCDIAYNHNEKDVITKYPECKPDQQKKPRKRSKIIRRFVECL